MDGEVYNGKTLLKMDDLGLKPPRFSENIQIFSQRMVVVFKDRDESHGI